MKAQQKPHYIPQWTTTQHHKTTTTFDNEPPHASMKPQQKLSKTWGKKGSYFDEPLWNHNDSTIKHSVVVDELQPQFHNKLPLTTTIA